MKHPATLTAGAFLTATHLNLYTKPWTTKHFWTSPTSLVCLSFNEALAKLNLLRFVSAPLEHSGDVHFAICLVSFLIKGYQLEQSRGSKGFLKLVFWGFFNTSLAFVLVTKLCAEAFADQSYLQQCVHGLTGPLFALKVVCLLETDTVWTPAAMFEIFELLILVEERTRIWHLSGALAGFLTYLWVPAYSWTGTGIRLGGRSPNVPDEAGDRVRREPWTRSWGYANYPQAGPNRLQSNLEGKNPQVIFLKLFCNLVAVIITDTLDEDIDSGSEVSFATNRSPSHFDSEMGSQPRKAKSASPSGYHTDASLEDLNRSFEDDDGTLEEPLEMDDEEIAEIEKIAERRRLHRSLSPSPSLAPKSGNPALPPANGEIGFNKVFRTPDRDEVRRKRLEKFDKQI